MPALDKITINLATLVEIATAAGELNYKGDIKIIDTGITFTIRDSNEMFLTEVKKPEQVIDQPA